jgi:tetratricopeptide (TPR) repeat protein
MTESTGTPAKKPRIDLIKWSLGCAGLGMILFAGISMIALIVTPMVFRSLEPEYQARIVRYLPFMASFQPTHPYTYLPTAVATSANALALLKTGSPMPVRTAQGSGGLSAGDDTTVGGGPTPALVTVTPTLPGDTPVPTPVVKVPIAQPTDEPSRPGPAPTEILAPRSFQNTSFELVPQDWNSCGPANLTQALHYYGWQGAQKDAQGYLKPNREDRNVSPWQMVTYVNQKTGVRALWRIAGDMKLIKKLVSHRFAVILEMGYEVPGQGWMGHYATITGYDDNTATIYWLDSNEDNPEKGRRQERTSDFDARWQQFNRLYIVVYLQERESELAAILGSDADLTYNYTHALSVARTEASEHPDNPFAWFNLGSSYTLLGQYQEAVQAFDQATSVAGGRLPFRILWYQFAPYEAYYNVGNYSQVIALTQTSSSYVEETFYWRGMAEAAMGRTDQAVEDFRRVLRFNQNFTLAADKLAQVQNGNFTPPVIAQAR